MAKQAIEVYYYSIVNTEQFVQSAKSLQKLRKVTEDEINKAVQKGCRKIKLDFSAYKKEMQYVSMLMAKLGDEGFFITHKVSESDRDWDPIYEISWDYTECMTPEMSDKIFHMMLEMEFDD